jgi:putative membrane-bound dehydrogenase-like protein
MSCSRSLAARPLVAVGVACCIAACLVSTAWAQHGQFDKEPLNPRDEAAIFTPPGQEREGKPAVASGPEAGRLNVTIVDRATGRPTACRVNVVGADGNFYEPQKNSLAAFSLNGTWPERLAGNRPTKAPIRYFGHFFYTTGKFTVAVPAGAARIEVWKGFEYAPQSQNVEVVAGTTRDAQVTIANDNSLATRGWHSGDPHLHFIRASDADETTIFDLLEAEDIRMGMVLCYNETNAYPGLMPELVTPQLRGLGRKSIRRRGDYQITSGQEYRNVVSGHLNLFLRDQLVLEGTKLDPNRGPAFGTIGSETREQGGYSFHAHGGYAQEIWADLVQGATDGVELLQFGIYRGIGLEGWYHVLGAGFRFPGVAACDYPACRKLGDCRTYVYIDGEANFPDWLEGAAEGRSFMTTGPLILLEVDGHRPGDIITTKDSAPLSVKVRVTVESPTAPVTHVQLVVGGRVVREQKVTPTPPGQPQKIELTETIVVDESSWIAARAFSKAPTGSPDAEAHTNPVYVYLNGKPPCRAADVDWLLARVDEQIADHEARKEPEKAASVDYFRCAREILVEMRRRGEPPEPPKRIAVNAVSASADAKSLVPAAATLRGDSLADFLKPQAALTPEEAVKSFEVQAGFRMELVAHEPDVTDPVAACFDENGGMYVAEMLDYPYRPKEGQTPLGRVRYLEDADGDGKYECSWIFADKLVWPTGVVCWKGGVYVAAAPDIWYLKDADGDHRADVIEKVYTGFGDRNQQGGVNNLNWHVDHKIYGSGSTNGGAIRRADKDEASPIVLSSRDFRFDPVTGAFETVSGSKQFGNAFDDWFNRFLCSESKPSYHVVLPQHYLARNPNLAVPTALNDLAPGVTPIFRISPIERWRQVRSSRRLVAGERSPTSAGLSHNVIDAAAGLTIYRGHAYPSAYLGNEFIGCSQNNLVHRRRLTAQGPTFRSERADANTEFVRSTDTWFRPVNCINAPDGTLYVLDMSREVIESIHIANDVVKLLDLTNGRDKGRIYRLAPPGFVPQPAPRLGKATSAELVSYLEHPGGWWRDTAGRLIFERQDPGAVAPLRRRLAESPSALGRMHILWALDGLGALEERDLMVGLADATAGVREHSVRLAESRLGKAPALVEKVLSLAADPDSRVRFQVAFSLGEIDAAQAVEALAAIAARDATDPWTRTAVLSSCVDRAHRVLAALAQNAKFVAQPAAPVWFEQLATIVGARNKVHEVKAVLDATAESSAREPAVQTAAAMGLGAGLQRSGSSLSAARSAASPASAAMLDQLVQQAVRTSRDANSSVAERQEALRTLSLAGGSETRDALAELVEPQQPEALQISAVKILAQSGEPRVAERLIAAWRRSTPKLQEEIIAALASRPAWAGQLLDACDEKQVTAGQVTASTRTALVNHQDSAVREHAAKVFGQASSRAEVIAGYQSALASPGDALRGEKVYERECMACHRLGERGFQVGPNLALIRNRTPQALLEAILDPNREVQPSYVNYVVTDDAGRTVSGLIVAETANSITLARDKGATDTLQKSNIEEITSTGKSLMPEGLERTVDPQGLADLLAFLKQVQYDIGTLPDFVEPKN